MSKTVISSQSGKPVTAKKGRPKKVSNGEEKNKLTYEQRKELKLKAQKKKEAEKAKAGAPANADRFYVTNKELMDEMIKWRDSNKDPEKRIISNRFGEMMLAISSKVLNRSEFRNYPKEVKEDMASFGHYKLLKGMKNYDFKFTNVFSYVTQCYWNAYLSVLKKHYKHINIKKDLMEKLLSEMQTFPGMNAASSLGKCIKAYIDDGCSSGDVQ